MPDIHETRDESDYLSGSDAYADTMNRSGDIIESYPLRCRVCGHSWSSGKRKAGRCPKCRSSKWDDDIVAHNKCKRCGYIWIGNTQKCPHCLSTKWNLSSHECVCKRCGNKWMSRSDEPARCPACKTTKWDEAVKTIICSRCGKSRPMRNNSRTSLCPECDVYRRSDTCNLCGHMWTSSRETKTRFCPGCGSAEWSEDHHDRLSDHSAASRALLSCNGDVRKFSTLTGTDIGSAEIFIAFHRGESGVSISMRTGLAFSDIMEIVKTMQEKIRARSF